MMLMSVDSIFIERPPTMTSPGSPKYSFCHIKFPSHHKRKADTDIVKGNILKYKEIALFPSGDLEENANSGILVPVLTCTIILFSFPQNWFGILTPSRETESSCCQYPAVSKVQKHYLYRLIGQPSRSQPKESFWLPAEAAAKLSLGLKTYLNDTGFEGSTTS